jgi:hypothetical protein
MLPGVFVERDAWTGRLLRYAHSAIADSCIRSAPTGSLLVTCGGTVAWGRATNDAEARFADPVWRGPSGEKAVEAVRPPATSPARTAHARAEREGKYGIRED